jgi:UDP-N-acetylmuramate--alanine ligase
LPQDATFDLSQRMMTIGAGIERPRPTLACPTSAAYAHFLGIGGTGMRALATVLQARGWRVSGSDRCAESHVQIDVNGWPVVPDGVRHVDFSDVDLLIASDAIHDAHPLRRRAKTLGVPVKSYAEMLGGLLDGQRGAAIAGTHGKSTTTAMTAETLIAAGLDPTVVCGAVPLGDWSATGGRAGREDVVLVEACEFRRNFLHLRPHIAVLTGIEPDHFDCYQTTAQLERGFCEFAGNVDARGVLIVRRDCQAAARAAQAAQCRVESFGADAEADWVAQVTDCHEGCYEFELRFRGRKIGKIQLPVPGIHNVLNAVAAAAVACHYGARPADVVHGLSRFSGLRRRLQPLGLRAGVAVWDDYAHHPTEIAAAVRTLKHIHPGSRIVAVFQPHQASRTAALFDEFVDSLNRADAVVLAPIFRAREGPPRPGEVTSADLAARIRRGGTPTIACGDFKSIAWALKLVCCRGDVLVTLGAGDIWKVSHAFAN